MACGTCGNKKTVVKASVAKPQIVKVSPVNANVIKASQIIVK